MLAQNALEPKIDEAARLMGMFAQPHRLRILCILLEGEQSVSSLVALTGLSQPAMSQHLKKLRDAGFVRTRRSAQTIYHSIKGREVEAVLEVLHSLYCSDDKS